MTFGLRACQQGLSVRYARCVDLLDDLYAGLGDGSYHTRLKRWCAPALLIMDDVGLGQVKKREDEPTAAHTLYNLLDRRQGHVATAITSNLKLSAWGRYLGDPTLAAAILDRLAMRALRLDIDGPSYRQHLGQERAQARRHRARRHDRPVAARRPSSRNPTSTGACARRASDSAGLSRSRGAPVALTTWRRRNSRLAPGNVSDGIDAERALR